MGPSLVGKLLPIGIGLIFIGFFLMMAAAVMTGAGKGVVFLFPFYVGTVESPVGLSILAAVFILTMLPALVPWLLGPRRVWRALSSMISSREGAVKEAKAKVRSYYLTVDVSGVDRASIAIQAFRRRIEIRGRRRGGEPFARSFEFPGNTAIRLVEHEYSGNFILLRVQVEET